MISKTEPDHQAVAAADSAIFHRTWNETYNIASGGDGCYILHADGSRTLDGCSGAAVSCLGHGHKGVIEAIVKQARSMAWASTSFFTSTPAEELAQLLLDMSDNTFSRVVFLSSGSEAVESAIKLARHYFVGRGETQRFKFISRLSGYHGNTLGALAAGHNPPRRAPFEPLLSSAFHHVSRCLYPIDARPNESEDAYLERLIDEYESMFQQLGPDTVAAVLIETVSGATLGAATPAKGYLARLRDVCDKHGALLIFDEIMCGMGRAGTLHAWQSFGNVRPDLQTIGKGLSAGYQPVSAVLINDKVARALQQSGDEHPFNSGHTYQGHSIGCAAALETLRTFQKERLLENVSVMGELLEGRLRATVPCIKEIRGMGLFRGVEFDTTADNRMAASVAKKCLQSGLAVYLCSDAVDAVLFAPPFIIGTQEVDEMVRMFDQAVREVVA